jgi:hypothetical protein
MFSERSLSGELSAVRDEHAPGALVLDVDADFETLPPASAEELGLLADSLSPTSYPDEWLPADAPALLRQYASDTFTVGMPGDGTVVWTGQTTPPTVLVKKRAEGTPDAFLEFLLAEAFVQVGLAVPEHHLPFFGERYRDLDAAVGLGPVEVYQVAGALYEAWVGLRARPTFESWAADRPGLHEAWVDAGERLSGRLSELPGAVARGETEFAAATEYACSAVKHGLDLPAPFDALDTAAYRDHGADYAVQWAETTFEKLREE